MKSQDIFIDSNLTLIRETKYGICFDIKRKKLTLTLSKKFEINTKGPPVVSIFDFHRKIKY